MLRDADEVMQEARTRPREDRDQREECLTRRQWATDAWVHLSALHELDECAYAVAEIWTYVGVFERASQVEIEEGEATS